MLYGLINYLKMQLPLKVGSVYISTKMLFFTILVGKSFRVSSGNLFSFLILTVTYIRLSLNPLVGSFCEKFLVFFITE